MQAATSDAQRINLMFRAFSEPTRLRVLRLLQGGELCVGDLAAALQVAQPSVSRHLAYLKRAGLVAVRKAGLWKYYSLTSPTSSTFHQNLLHCLESCFADIPDFQADAERATRLKQSGACCPT